MLLIKAFHIIFMVCWFAGIFYLPRLYVYHAGSHDAVSLARFKVMERKLYYGIMTPSAVLTTVFGVRLLSFDPAFYFKQPWMHAKLGLVALLWIYHGYCGVCRKRFFYDNNTHGQLFYRWLNEAPVLLLVAIVILVVVKPSF